MGTTGGDCPTASGSLESYQSEEDIVEIQAEKNSRTDIPIIPPSRFSIAFREYLEAAKRNAHPGIFPDQDWKELNRRKGKPAISTINKNDLSIIWKEVRALAVKYKYEELRDWMPVHYFLSGCLLKAKIDCLKSIEAGGALNEKAALVVKDAKRMLMFQDFIMTEMMYRYIEMGYEKKKDKNDKANENDVRQTGVFRKQKGNHSKTSRIIPSK